ncbi:hypothetical protein OB955_09930 [Halobacteria archaeon AArc-m2/3/4]|uniref:Uncharacterized protein n=1 Tax=Natronoglomus mannanivorans TaxID=2979990 RepID=A0AAP2YVQ8_9EURY|nr:hypothetical protein [Halobacteria archaeon AArc-xg1-1]MCU4973060.1 hypothetical protein [Halobacteria archaeon AArc-m2/3/4]
MTMYADRPSSTPLVDRWGDDEGVSWIAHPAEEGQRASHAVRCEEGVWIVDPLEARGVHEAITELGPVAGVAVLSSWHARDAGEFARRYDVPVSLPTWMTRVEARVDAPVERYERTLGESGIHVSLSNPLPTWREGIAYRESDGTLLVPESAGTAAPFLVGDERLGLELSRRLRPPRVSLAGLEPERVLVGHGPPVYEDATAALDEALATARRRFPRALVEHGPDSVRSVLEAVRK